MNDCFGNPIIESFSGPYSFLSNFYDAPLSLWGVEFPTSEHAYQWAKTADPLEQQYILFKYAKLDGSAVSRSPFSLSIPTAPGVAKQRSKQITRRPDFDKDAVMAEVVAAKFEQNPVLFEKLRATDPAILIEGNNWHDNYWGSCVCSDCTKEPKENRLGKLSMAIRDSSTT